MRFPQFYTKIITLFILGISNQFIAQNPIPVTSNMVILEGNSNPEVLFDGDNSTYWFAGWNSSNYPAFCYIDFGQPINLSKVELYDFSGEGGFNIYMGSPGDWNPNPIIADPLEGYLNWNEYSIDITTQFLRLEMVTSISRVGEVKIFEGTTSGWGEPPVIDPIDNLVVSVGDSATINVSATFTDELNTSGIPAFIGFVDNGNGNGTYSIHPETAADTGIYFITIEAVGPDGTDENTFVITIEAGSGQGDSPVINAINDLFITVDNSTTINVSATNTDELIASGLPSFVDFVDNGNGEGSFSINPQMTDIGVYDITVEAVGPNGMASETFSITVEQIITNAENRCEILTTQIIFGEGDLSNLFDEQVISGNPRNGPGGNPTEPWFAGWDASNFPAVGYADLGQERLLTRIFIRDINGDGSFKIFAGTSPMEWDSIPIIEDGLTGYAVWNEHPVNVTTRYLRFEMGNPSSNVAEILIYGNCPAIADNVSPAMVDDLTVTDSSFNNIALQWTATGNDGYDGIANNYDLRYSTSPITEQNFYDAYPVNVSNPNSSGSLESFLVQDLNCGAEYYLAIKVVDDANNSSTISNIANKVTASCPTDDFTITITLSEAPSNVPEVKSTKLRYNKDFVYSLSVDDGDPWTYYNTFPILSGGTLWSGEMVPGSFYTDGCGNDIAFTGAISLNGYHIHEEESNAYMSWEQAQEIYNANWDVLSHGYQHCAYDSCDYDAEVLNNTAIVASEIGFTMTHFAVPSGDDGGYREPAYNNGILALHDQDWMLPGYDGLKVDTPLDLFRFELNRNTLETETLPFGEDVDMVADKSDHQNHYWYSEYAHRIGNVGEPYITILIDDFRNYMSYLEDTYGRDGSDRLWVAPVQEVYEYLWVRDKVIKTTTNLSDNQLTVNYSFTNIPNTLRRNALSLFVNLENNITITNVTVSQGNVTFNSDGLINLSW